MLGMQDFYFFYLFFLKSNSRISCWTWVEVNATIGERHLKGMDSGFLQGEIMNRSRYIHIKIQIKDQGREGGWYDLPPLQKYPLEIIPLPWCFQSCRKT